MGTKERGARGIRGQTLPGGKKQPDIKKRTAVPRLRTTLQNRRKTTTYVGGKGEESDLTLCSKRVPQFLRGVIPRGLFVFQPGPRSAPTWKKREITRSGILPDSGKRRARSKAKKAGRGSATTSHTAPKRGEKDSAGSPAEKEICSSEGEENQAHQCARGLIAGSDTAYKYGRGVAHHADDGGRGKKK